MNFLTNKLPDTLEIGSESYPIETDFRKWIAASQIMSSSNLTAISFAKIVVLVFKEESNCPPASEETVTAILDFFNPFKIDTVKSSGTVRQRKIYDFEYDAKHIFSSFMQQYGIDLTKTEMHWWAFKALLDGLSDSTSFGKILQFRCTDITQIKDAELKKYYQKMQRLHALPDNRTDEEKERAFADNLIGSF